MFEFLYPELKHGEALDRGHRTFMRHNYVQVELDKNLTRAMAFHRGRKDYINNDNLFVQLIKLLPRLDEMSNSAYLTHITELMDSFTTSFGISTERNYGSILEYNVYGNIPEVWMSVTGTPKDEPYFKVLRHPFTGTNLPSFTGTKEYRNLDKHDIAVFSLDIPRLAVDYRTWDIANRKKPIDEQEDTVYYVTTIIMPMLLPSHMEVSVFNLLDSRTFGGRLLKDERLNGIILTDVSYKLRESLDEVVDHLMSGGVGITELLNHTPTVKGKVLKDVVGGPGPEVFRTMRWASILANAPLLIYILSLIQINGAVSEKHINNDIKRKLKHLRTDSALRNQLDDKVAKIVNYEVDVIIDLL